MGNRRLPPFVTKWGKDGESGKLVEWAKDKYGLELDPLNGSGNLVKAIQDHKAAQPDTPPGEAGLKGQTDFDPEVVAGAAALPALHTVPPLPDAVPRGGTAFAPPAPGVSETTAIPFSAESETAIAPAPVQSEVALAPAPRAAHMESPGEVADRQAEAAQARPNLPQPKNPSMPLDPYQAAGLEAGGRKKDGLFFLPDGTPLKPDTSPVLSEAQAARETNSHNIDPRTGLPFPDVQNSWDKSPMPEEFNGPQRHTNFRHPQGTKLLLNPQTGVAYRPTEPLMRRDGFIPHFSPDMPKGYVFGG